VKLKQDYTNLLKEKEGLSTEMASYKKKLETKDRDSEAKISKYMAELADVRATLATTQADAIKMEQKLKGQFMELQDRYKEMEMKLGQEGKNYEEMQQMIDEADREKQILVKENKELQALCEELMGIVEGNTAVASK
jgi:chromosome segregation ATPase